MEGNRRSRAFKLPGGGLEKTSAALLQLGCYEWNTPSLCGSDGMPLRFVGKSGVAFRETRRKAESEAIRRASSEFPELQNFGWPERGTEAEWKSLKFQAGRHRGTVCPENIDVCIDRLCAKYPPTKPRREIRGNVWDEEEVAEALAEIAKREVNPKASPGVPLSVLGSTNQAIIDRHLDFLVLAALSRLQKLSRYNLVGSGLSPSELVRLGFCDPVRLFVKQEPHPKSKIDQGRFRLISSVSLVDQLVERMLFGPQNNAEIDLWDKIPSKPGMGLSVDEQSDLLWRDVQFKHLHAPACEADISGFDWSVQYWELLADVKMRIYLSGASGPTKMAMSSRFYCFANSVFQLSDGTLIEQGEPGLMKSGSYCTSSTNSRISLWLTFFLNSESS